MQDNIVEFFSDHSGYRCGYCKNSHTNYSHGLWAHTLNPDAYAGLLNRGWRRSGKYVYKPMNNLTCCPCYTISCHVNDFRLSRSQRKVLKRFNEYLVTGNMKSRHKGSRTDLREKFVEVINYEEGAASSCDIKIGLHPSDSNEINITTPTDIPDPAVAKRPKNTLDEQSVHETLPLSRVEPPRKSQKAKYLRMERKKQKLIAKGLSPEEIRLKLTKTPTPCKVLEDYFLNPPNAKHKLTVRMVRAGSDEFETQFLKEHEIYKKYQMVIHNDAESECTPKQFKRFLCDNPLNDTSDSDSETGLFHQQYFIDDQLFAVGVVDVLPNCLSSVYFFYDPAFMDLNLGTFGALREIGFVRQKYETNPTFEFYYLGFYIHSCVKMRYKGNFSPSYLLCPETYKWKLLDDELRLNLTKTKYFAFYSAPETLVKQNIEKAFILYRRCIMPYSIYVLQRSKDDTNVIQEYCNLVGAENAQKICLYRSSTET